MLKRKFKRRQLMLLILLALVLGWFFAGVFQIAPAEQGLLLRFGKVQRLLNPGWHWRIYGIDQFYRAATTESSLSYQNEFLTEDAKLVFVTVTVGYKIANLEDYFFVTAEPLTFLQDELSSVMFKVVAANNFVDVTSVDAAKRSALEANIFQSLQTELHHYHLGLQLTNVVLKEARLPAEIAGTLLEPEQAKILAQHITSEAEKYHKEVLLQAEQKAFVMIQSAEHEKSLLLLRAKAEQLIKATKIETNLTIDDAERKKLYLEALDKLLATDQESDGSSSQPPTARVNTPPRDSMDRNQSRLSEPGDE